MNNGFVYDDMYLGFAQILHALDDWALDIDFACSRDGEEWQRAAGDVPLAPGAGGRRAVLLLHRRLPVSQAAADALEHPLRWRGGDSVAALHGRWITLEIELREAELFAVHNRTRT